METFIKNYKKLVGGLTYAASMVSGLCIVATAFIIVYEIIMRGIFHAPTEWVLEVSVYLILGAGFLGLAVAYREKSHVRVNILAERLSERSQLWMDVFTTVLGILFFLVFMTESMDVVTESLEFNRISPSTLQFPLWIPQCTLVVGSVLLELELCLHFFELIHTLKVSK